MCELELKPSMSIVELHQLIVQMRKYVKQSKVRVINKLTKQMRQLKRKGKTDEDKIVFQRKADKLLTEIKEVKRLHCDSVSKLALININSWQQLANTSDLTKRCMGRLITDKAMLDFVTEWRKKHEDWKVMAGTLLQHVSRRVNTKKKKKQPSPQNQKISETDTVNGTNQSEEGSVEALETQAIEDVSMEIETLMQEDESSDAISEHTENNNIQQEKEKHQVKTLQRNVIERQQDMTTQPNYVIKAQLNQKKAKTMSVLPEHPSVEEPSPSSTMEPAVEVNKEQVIRRINLDLDDPEDWTRNQGDTDLTFVFTGTKQLQKDPFFDEDEGDDNDGEDKEYLEGHQVRFNKSSFVSSLDRKPVNRFRPYNKEPPPQFRFGEGKKTMNCTISDRKPQAHNQHYVMQGVKDFTRKPSYISKSYKQSSPFEPMKKHKAAISKTSVSTFKPSQYDKNTSAPKVNSSSKVSQTLHPSWEASRKRKKEQTQIKAFQGKKIVFDD